MSINEPWEICPDCGCGRGVDHRKDCPRRMAPRTPDYSKGGREEPDDDAQQGGA